MARAKRSAVNGSTAASAAPSRRCTWASSGRPRVSRSFMPHHRSSAAPLRPLRQQQLEGPAHAEAGDLRADVREPAAARSRGEIHVYPGEIADESLQEARCEDVIALAVDRALHDIGDLAVQIAVEILIERKAPDPLAAHAAGRQ